eukprot:1168001_1
MVNQNQSRAIGLMVGISGIWKFVKHGMNHIGYDTLCGQPNLIVILMRCLEDDILICECLMILDTRFGKRLKQNGIWMRELSKFVEQILFCDTAIIENSSTEEI